MMVNRASPDPDESVRRFLVDRRFGERRCGRERRRGERRVLALPVANERRSGRDRRTPTDRRDSNERRFPPSSQFSWEETRTIQQMLVHCTGCKNSAVIVD
jgi:hypothetical protein